MRRQPVHNRHVPCVSESPFFRGTGLCAASFLAASLVLGLMSRQAGAVDKPKMETHTQTFSVRLSATRVIYDPSSMGATLTVTNPQDYPILVQSHVLAEDMKGKAPFVVTPPLFRLDGQQQSRLRIVRTGGDFAKDRESIQWLCVKGIPPKADYEWAKDKDGKSAADNKTISLNVQMSINSCIKLFVRPYSVKGHPDDVAASLVWYRQGNQLKATNDSPFYMNLSSLTVGGRVVRGLHYVPPFSSYNFTLPEGASGKIAWRIINDYGGESSYQADMK